MMRLREWLRYGVPQLWLSAAAVTACILMTLGLIGLVGYKGLAYFVPRAVVTFNYPQAEGPRMAGEFVAHERVPRSRVPDAAGDADPIRRSLLLQGNREYVAQEFVWTQDAAIHNLEYPHDIMVLERREWGRLYGYLQGYAAQAEQPFTTAFSHAELQRELQRSAALRQRIDNIERGNMGRINAALEKLRIERRRLERHGESALHLDAEQQALHGEFAVLSTRLQTLYAELQAPRLLLALADDREVQVPLADIVRAYQPNALNLMGQTALYLERLWEFLSAEPREANTEGGVFPAIFGTVLLVLIMSVIVTPFGVITALFLHEYAGDGVITRLVRVSVNNLAGVPSVVYGVFGLGFFVYFTGGHLDRVLFPHVLPTPVFGTPGLLWSALTLALLTVPVVVVATEEGLTRVPRAMREGSLALGATHAETLWHIVLPAVLPAILTGLILAVARAAGEVAPLMLVGVVKLAPALPVDGSYPFLHLERKFMHLGFHIYDVGFQSPNAESARPLLYATAFLLVLLIIALNLTAIRIRHTLRSRYGTRSE